MKNSIICLSLGWLLIAGIQAQEASVVATPQLRIGIEAGTNVFFGERNKPDMIGESGSQRYDTVRFHRMPN